MADFESQERIPSGVLRVPSDDAERFSENIMTHSDSEEERILPRELRNNSSSEDGDDEIIAEGLIKASINSVYAAEARSISQCTSGIGRNEEEVVCLTNPEISKHSTCIRMSAKASFAIFLWTILIFIPLVMIGLGMWSLNDCPGERMLPICSILVGCILMSFLFVSAEENLRIFPGSFFHTWGQDFSDWIRILHVILLIFSFMILGYFMVNSEIEISKENCSKYCNTYFYFYLCFILVGVLVLVMTKVCTCCRWLCYPLE